MKQKRLAVCLHPSSFILHPSSFAFQCPIHGKSVSRIPDYSLERLSKRIKSKSKKRIRKRIRSTSKIKRRNVAGPNLALALALNPLPDLNLPLDLSLLTLFDSSFYVSRASRSQARAYFQLR